MVKLKNYATAAVDYSFPGLLLWFLRARSLLTPVVTPVPFFYYLKKKKKSYGVRSLKKKLICNFKVSFIFIVGDPREVISMLSDSYLVFTVGNSQMLDLYS